ncbi:transcriptional regulator [Acetobacter nitrogenifigens DSM 23921 = NBRC 105050]|uniref:Transcriptional regulator ArgP n=1 Tax=Acetobacter nitrogenifigens DSM 23921 = NBRC 105050 TaxID=1120919 RepID=A0A511XD47_9PROT|nr:LysR family transcriptional regulator ArgP [Acetobacter nitrogenifigens]GBQ91439.1 transcriptional regulator [Acetobacter nitrogenifigens DSM 23921 = NBRC 105050]GEN60872.1 transcriptional regulator ArgP [Acetobacter nitrogenifigens DSM 23921 = NBRC 105050]
MLDYPALSAMAAVIREGGFERAAERLRITPSAVSQRVRSLEEKLGAVTIVRGKPCAPTELGALLCAHLDKVRLMENDLAAQLPLGAVALSESAVTLGIAVNADSLATWFPDALARFTASTSVLVDLKLDDEAHTAQRLRSGEVLAAVTADPDPVQGCQITQLGALRYVACASPAFAARYFPNGVTPTALAEAPVLRFDRRDALLTRWMRAACGGEPSAPTHWAPSTAAFVDLAMIGVAWSLNPLPLVRPHLADGRLIDLAPGQEIDVPLYWQAARLEASALRRLTDAVRTAAALSLEPPASSRP